MLEGAREHIRSKLDRSKGKKPREIKSGESFSHERYGATWVTSGKGFEEFSGDLESNGLASGTIYKICDRAGNWSDGWRVADILSGQGNGLEKPLILVRSPRGEDISHGWGGREVEYVKVFQGDLIRWNLDRATREEPQQGDKNSSGAETLPEETGGAIDEMIPQPLPTEDAAHIDVPEEVPSLGERKAEVEVETQARINEVRNKLGNNDGENSAEIVKTIKDREEPAEKPTDEPEAPLFVMPLDDEEKPVAENLPEGPVVDSPILEDEPELEVGTSGAVEEPPESVEAEPVGEIGDEDATNDIETPQTDWDVSGTTGEDGDEIPPEIKNETPDFSQASSWKEIYEILRENGGLAASFGHKDAEYWIEQIEAVKSGEKDLGFITENGGLRNKVEELLKKEPRGESVENDPLQAELDRINDGLRDEHKAPEEMANLLARKKEIEVMLQERGEAKTESVVGEGKAPYASSEEKTEAQTEVRDSATQDRRVVPDVVLPEEFVFAKGKTKNWAYSRGPGEDFKVVDSKNRPQTSDQAREEEAETAETPRPEPERQKDNGRTGSKNETINTGNEAEKGTESDQETTDEETKIRRLLDENERRTKELQNRLDEIRGKKSQGDRSGAETRTPKTGETDTTFQEWAEQNTGMDESFRQSNYAEEELKNKEIRKRKNERLDFARRKLEEIIAGEGVIKDLGIMIKPEWEKIEQVAEYLEKATEDKKDEKNKDKINDMEIALITLRDRLQAELASEKSKRYESSTKKAPVENKAKKLLDSLNELINS